MSLSAERLQAAEERLRAEVGRWLEHHQVEPHYSAETIAELLEVEPRSVANYARIYEESRGREGLGPKVFLSHKAVRFAASSLRRFLEQRTLAVERAREPEEARA